MASSNGSETEPPAFAPRRLNVQALPNSNRPGRVGGATRTVSLRAPPAGEERELIFG